MLKTLMIAAAGALSVALAAPALAGDDHRHGHRHFKHHYKDHHRHYGHFRQDHRPVVVMPPPRVYYAPPAPVYYGAPPVVYRAAPVYSAPESSVSIRLHFPL